jgi:hypothetical protein
LEWDEAAVPAQPLNDGFQPKADASTSANAIVTERDLPIAL